MSAGRIAAAAARRASRALYGQNRRLERGFAGEEWMRELLRCQQRVAETASEYYRRQYRGREKCWWIRVPQWIWASRSSGAGRIADLGAGYGTLALFCRAAHPSAEISCFDRRPATLAPGLGAYRITCREADIGRLEGGKKYDIVLLTEVLEHLDFHPSVALSAVRGMLAPGGVAYLSTPDAGQWGRVTKYYRSVDEMPRAAGRPRADDHIYQYTSAELRQLIGEAGLAVREWGYSPGVNGRHFNLALGLP